MLAALQEVPSSARTRSLFARDAGMDDPALLPGRSDFELAWKPTAHLYVADDRLVMESNTPKVDIEEPMTFADGRTIWLRINKVPLRDAGGGEPRSRRPG
jgi:PAS fold